MHPVLGGTAHVWQGRHYRERDVLWDNPGLEGLFVRLEGEFEIRERHTAIERKLNLIANTVHTVLELVSSKHAPRVE